MKLVELIEGIDKKTIFGETDLEITGISDNTYKLKEGFLFVCIKGYKIDGHSFLFEAIEKKAKAAIIEIHSNIDIEFFKTKLTLIEVTNSRKVLSSIANKFFKEPSCKLKVIGITGTNGKTTTTFMVDTILKKAGFKTGVISTILYRIGTKNKKSHHTTPQALELQELLEEMVEEKVDVCTMEVSSHALALNRVDDVNFDIACFMNLTQDHLDFHQDFLNYREAKSKLFNLLTKQKKNTSKWAIINIDDPNSSYLIKNISSPILTFGIEKEADIKAYDIHINIDSFSFKIKSKEGEKKIELGLIGKFNIYNTLAAIAITKALGLDMDTIIEGLKAFSPVLGRFEKIDCQQDFSVIIDYAHTPDALENLLTTVKNLTSGKVITVFGCGGERDRGKRPLMGEIASRLSDYVIITNDNPRNEDPLRIIIDIEIGMNKYWKNNYRKIIDRFQAIETALNMANKNDTVVIAGKGHEDYQILGEKVIHFSDQEVVREILKKKKTNKYLKLCYILFCILYISI